MKLLLVFSAFVAAANCQFGSGSFFPQSPQFNAPQSPQFSRPQGSQYNAPQGSQFNAPQGPQVNRPQGLQINAPQGPQINAPQGLQINAPQGPQFNAPQGLQINAPQGPQLNAPQGLQINAPQGPQFNAPQGSKVYPPQDSLVYPPQDRQQAQGYPNYGGIPFGGSEVAGGYAPQPGLDPNQIGGGYLNSAQNAGANVVNSMPQGFQGAPLAQGYQGSQDPIPGQPGVPVSGQDQALAAAAGPGFSWGR